MQILACPGCDRVFFEYGNSTYKPLCPECGRRSTLATPEQNSKFVLHKFEHHFSPCGLRLDALEKFKEKIKAIDYEKKNLENSIKKIEDYYKEKK